MLADEGAVAREALVLALDDLKTRLAQAADLRLWAQEHPWASVGIAAAAGFTAATAIAGTIDQGGKSATKAEEAARAAAVRAESAAAAAVGQRPGVASRLGEFLFDLLKETVARLATTAFHPPTNSTQQAPAASGSPGPLPV